MFAKPHLLEGQHLTLKYKGADGKAQRIKVTNLEASIAASECRDLVTFCADVGSGMISLTLDDYHSMNARAMDALRVFHRWAAANKPTPPTLKPPPK